MAKEDELNNEEDNDEEMTTSDFLEKMEQMEMLRDFNENPDDPMSHEEVSKLLGFITESFDSGDSDIQIVEDLQEYPARTEHLIQVIRRLTGNE